MLVVAVIVELKQPDNKHFQAPSGLQGATVFITHAQKTVCVRN